MILAKGDSDDVYMVGKIASFQTQNLLVAYKERFFDKDNFIKNLLLDNLLLVDIYNRSKKLHIETDVKRIALIVETNLDKESNSLEIVRAVIGSKSKDFVTAVMKKALSLSKKSAIRRHMRICANMPAALKRCLPAKECRKQELPLHCCQ